MDQWYIARNGQQEGPVTSQQIQALAKAGSLDPATGMVWREGLPDWITLGDSGLLAETGSVPPVAVSPNITNPYHVSERTRNSVAEKGSDSSVDYPGYGRLRYFLSLLVTTIVFYAILFAVVFAILSGKNGSGGAPALVMGLLFLLVVVSNLYFGVQRLKNLGMSGWAMLWSLVPIMNVWIYWRMAACPAGYEHHRVLDTPAKVITGLAIGMMGLSVIGTLIGELANR
jgi:uncharacterized membrane protein YhaH (DUF805 family)